MLINTTKDLKTAIRTPYAWPGGYAVNLVMGDGALMCNDCARREFRGLVGAMKGNGWDASFRPVAAEIHWEGPSEFCCHCDKELASEYGDPESEDN